MSLAIKKVFCLFSLLIIISYVGMAQDWKTYPLAPAGSLVVFPQDEGRHSNEPIEWWYVSGHLRGETTGSDYSFMVSYFHYPAYIFDGFRILNISNDDNEYFYSDTQAVNYNICSTDSLNLEVNVFGSGTEIFKNITAQDGNALPFEYELSTNPGPASLSLTLDAIKPPLILADSGYLYQGSNAYTYYYSLPKVLTEGSIQADGITENVSGTAWIDRQYGTFNPSTGQEYEWFCVQLSNGIELNINNIFSDDNLIPDDLKYRLLAASVDEQNQYTTSDLTIERLKYKYMSDFQRCYSQSWRITSPINNLDITLTTIKSTTEVFSPFRFYEGAVEVDGYYNGTAVTGKGFAELLHSYEKPVISVIDTADVSGNNYTVSWKVDNPDDGNPLLYDLYYSEGDSLSYQYIIQSISDTSYVWNTSVLGEGNAVWLKVKAYSIDTTLATVASTKLGSELVSAPPIEPEPDILIYPNPSKGMLTIQGSDIQEVTIIDSSGRILKSFAPVSLPLMLNLEYLIEGVYYIKISTSNNQYTRKLILK